MTQSTSIQNTDANSAKMTLPEFEQRLQSTDFFDAQTGQVSSDSRLQAFLTENPDSAALVRDLQYIAVAAKSLFDSDIDVEPSESVWSNIQSELKTAPESPNTLAAAPDTID